MRDLYTLEDLESRERLNAGAAKPARLAVLGWPVAHSASPQMHQPALDAHDIDARYIRLEVGPGRVAEAFERMRALGFIGCNVTVPHKLEAMAQCTVVDAGAQALGAVNTVSFEGAAIRGYNTDGPGFARAIEEQFGAPLGRLKVAIAGAGGGAGQAIATQALLTGVPRLVLINRSPAKLDPLLARLRDLAPACEIIALALDDADLARHCQSCELLVNTSSLGLKPGDASILPAACLLPRHWVYDTIYQPPVTPLLALATRTGCRSANGLSMLLHQGALAFQHWFPSSHPLAAMRAAMAGRTG